MDGKVGEELYSTARAAELLGVNADTVRRWIRLGKLPATKLGYKTVRVSRADLEAFLEAQRVAGTPKRGDR